MKKVYFFLLVVLSNTSVFAQVYTWATTDTLYNGVGGKADIVCDGIGNKIAAYGKKSGIYCEFVDIIKYDGIGNQLWKRRVDAVGIGQRTVDVTVDGLNNIYLTTNFAGDLYFEGSVCASASGGNMFVLKLDATGNFLWARHTTGHQAWGNSVTCDSVNNVYVVGFINGDATFDTVTVHAPVNYNFVAKYSPSGEFQWVRNPMSVGGTFGGYGAVGTATDKAGNTYIAGTFTENANFDSIHIEAFDGEFSQDVYIAKIDKDGNWLWARQAGGPSADAIYGRGLALGPDNHFYITGFFESDTAYFGSQLITNTGGDDYFVAKYDLSGTAIWAIGAGGPGSQTGTHIVVDNNGDPYITVNTAFLKKYSSGGIYQWSQYKTASNLALTVSQVGDIYGIGSFSGTVNFDSYSFSAPAGVQQMFVTRFGSISTDLTNIQTRPSLVLYPNPSATDICISASSLNPLSNYEFRIYDAAGRIVHLQTIETSTDCFKMEIDVSSLNRGLYFAHLSSLQGTFEQTSVKFVLH